MIYLSEKERQILAKAPTKIFVVTYSFAKDIKTIEVKGKSCGAIPLADEVSIFAVYDETGVESFVCDFDNFISVVEKSSSRSLRSKLKNASPLRIIPQ
jgi:hypothetical protein